MRPGRRWIAAALLVLLVAAALVARAVAPSLVASSLRRAARDRRLELRWERLRLPRFGAAELRRVLVLDVRGDTLVAADSLGVDLEPLSLALLRPRLAAVGLAHARVRWTARASGPDTLAADLEPPEAMSPRAQRLRRSAASLVRLLLAPARRLPRLEVRDLSIALPGDPDDPFRGGRVESLRLERAGGGIRLRARGALAFEREVPFEIAAVYGADDRLIGRALFGLGDGPAGAGQRLAVDGFLVQDRRAGVLRLADSTRVTIGRIPVRMGGALDRRGPRLTFHLAADGVTRDQVRASFAPPVLGPLEGLVVDGSFDYRLGLDLDLERPDSVRFTADVIPHGLALDRARSTLDLGRLEEPFLATIHLPRGRLVTRELSPANPFYRPLDAIDSTLVRAVLANEDGGFFHHRGFNTEAIAMAIAANVEAGAWRRGAGTITMQVARNLWLGHERTLSRKAQEVVLAWVLEHLAGVSKRRLLEIYLNIIEWGPGVQGAAEATRYYFDADPGRLTVDEALFLATVIPAPSRWRWRFAPDGTLRSFERSQMHFIGRAMIAKGWLAPEALPPRDSLQVTLRGPARDVLFPPARADSAAGPGVAEVLARAGEPPR